MVSRWTIPATRRNLIPTYTPVYNDLRLSRCASCQRVFTNKDDLRHHILLSHTGRKPHACGICGKRYGQLHHLNSHFKLHREPRLQVSDLYFHSKKLYGRLNECHNKITQPIPSTQRKRKTHQQKPHNYRLTTADKLALSSPTEVIDPLQLTYRYPTKEYKIRHKTPTPKTLRVTPKSPP